MKKRIKNPRMLIFMATGAALLIAIITSSIAWFTASGDPTVGTRAMQLSAKESASLDLDVPDLAAEYERYMGETGTEYDGPDSPYLVEYSPVIIDYAEDENMVNKFLTYSFDPASSYIQRVIHGSAPIPFTVEALWDNFEMNLVEITPRLDEHDEPVLDEENKPIYDPTGTVYRGENGYFRNVSDGTLLQLSVGKNYFTLNIYFQGDVGCYLLQSTMADIDEKYAFDYSDEIYMFAMFRLSTVFNVVNQHTLRLEGGLSAYGDTFSQLAHRIVTLNVDGDEYTSFDFTGFSLQNPDGTVNVYPVPELMDSGVIDYTHYFMDWFDTYIDENSATTHYFYRDTKENGTSDSVVTLSLRPLRDELESLYSCWGDSYVLTLENLDDIDDNEYVTEYYVRPQGAHYASAGYLTYAPATQSVSVNNPRGGLASNSNASGVGMGISHTIPAPTREGYRFLGWSLTQPEVDYAADANLSGLSLVFTSTNSYRYNFGASGNGHDTTLYAVWQELGVNVTIVVDSEWGHNYATVVADHITYNGTNYALEEDTANHCYTVTIEVPKHTDLSQITISGGVATITSTNTQKNLTLRTWSYLSGGIYYELDDYPLNIEEDVTLYAMWNQRSAYTITLDVNMYSSALLYNYGTIDVVNPINVEHYTVLIDNNYQGSFSDEDRHNITVKMLEGMTLADANLTVEWHRHGSGMGTNSFEGWYENANNDMATTSWSSITNPNATKYNTSTAITGDLMLYVRFR